ncbi:hypothetical protein [Persicitalea sp.]|uniref:hypothetical protein n=1 Tax=Persicitalea sp. TaxID=3100273 RepID=UPI0035938AA6
MKKNVDTLLLAAAFGLLVSLSPSARADGNQPDPATVQPPKSSFEVGMYRVKNSLTMNLLIEKKLGAQLVIMLLDERGRELHRESLGRRQQKCARLLNFAEIRDGTYTVVVKNGTEEVTKEIRLSTQTLYEMPRRLLVAGN